MRKAQTVQKIGWPAPDVVTKVVPVPTDGWDAITPLAEMDPKRAPILVNWVPRPGFVELRAGYLPYAFTSSNAVNTLMTYRSPTAEKLFAAAGDSIYDVTSPPGSASLTGLSSSQWQYANFTPSGGTAVLQCVNGADTLRQFDGTNWTVPAITGITGGTQAIANIHAQKKRLWYILKNSTQVAFMPTDAITGAIAGVLEIGNTWSKGGYLVTMATWTVDGGNGPQDYAVFISSFGETTVYSGTDPTNASAWTLVGTFQLAPPIGRRCTLQVGSDAAIITQQGVVPLSQALPFDPSAERSVAITARIQNAMAQASMNGSTYFGWQLISYPNQQLAILNVPIVSGITSNQYVMNTLTGAWCQFQGWNAACFEIFNGSLYFGDFSGYVNQAYVSNTDGGQPISYDMQCAFNWFDDPGRTKRMTMVQPLMVSDASVTPTLQVDEDFGTSSTAAPLTSFTGSTLWDTAVWDTSLWAGALSQLTSWYSVQAIGHALAVRMKISNEGLSTITGNFDIAKFDSAEFDTGEASASTLQVNAFNSILELGGFI